MLSSCCSLGVFAKTFFCSVWWELVEGASLEVLNGVPFCRKDIEVEFDVFPYPNKLQVHLLIVLYHMDIVQINDW